MITPGGSVDIKRKSTKSVGKKQRKRLEEGKEKALERSVKLEEKVKGREDRKVIQCKLVGCSTDPRQSERRPSKLGSKTCYGYSDLILNRIVQCLRKYDECNDLTCASDVKHVLSM